MGRDYVAKIMGIPSQEIEVWAAGLNHFQWLLQIREKNSGKDLYPLLRKQDQVFDPSFGNRLHENYCGVFIIIHPVMMITSANICRMAGKPAKKVMIQADERSREELQQEIMQKISGESDLREWLTPSGEKSGPSYCGSAS